MNTQGSCDGVLNGNSGVSQQLMQGGQLTGELRNLMGTILGGQSGENISLEQLLSGGNQGRLGPTKLSNPSPSYPPPAPTTPSSSNVGGWSGKKRVRSFDFEDNPKRRRSTPYSARQSGDKQHNKGLRHFSQRVCEKVREKGTTTYNEVADELVKELSESEKRTPGSSEIPIDHKNIRRRVYDALNVLMAMNIISKEKKEIKWIGLPTNSVQECQHIEAELVLTEERLQSKRSQLEDLLVQILAFKNLMRRNRDRVSALDNPSQNSAIGLPFLIVNTNRKTTIDCSISSDKSEYVFNFDNTFELHNDIDVLKKMGLDCGLQSGACSAEDLEQAKSMLPKAFESTLDEIVLAKTLPTSGSFALTPTHPGTSTLRPSPSLTSTPSLSSQSTPVTALPGSPQQLAAVLSSLTQGKHGTPIATSPGLVLGIQSPSGVRSTPGTPLITVPSPRAVTQLVSNALRGGKSSSVTARPLSFTSSPIASAKVQLHSHCPTQGTLSPLVKAAVSPASVTPIAPAPTGQSSSVYGTPTQQSSPQSSKSPGPKIVTVSKLPSTSEQLYSLMQQLQQNIQHNSLLKQLPLASSARTDPMTSQAGIGLTVQASQADLTTQTAQEALLASLLPNGLDTRN